MTNTTMYFRGKIIVMSFSSRRDSVGAKHIPMMSSSFLFDDPSGRCAGATRAWA